MKKITIYLDTEEDNMKIENAFLNWFKNNGEEKIFRKIEVEEE